MQLQGHSHFQPVPDYAHAFQSRTSLMCPLSLQSPAWERAGSVYRAYCAETGTRHPGFFTKAPPTTTPWSGTEQPSELEPTSPAQNPNSIPQAAPMSRGPAWRRYEEAYRAFCAAQGAPCSSFFNRPPRDTNSLSKAEEPSAVEPAAHPAPSPSSTTGFDLTALIQGLPTTGLEDIAAAMVAKDPAVGVFLDELSGHLDKMEAYCQSMIDEVRMRTGECGRMLACGTAGVETAGVVARRLFGHS